MTTRFVHLLPRPSAPADSGKDSLLAARSRQIRANIRRQYALLHDRQHGLRVALERFRTRQAELLFHGTEP